MVRRRPDARRVRIARGIRARVLRRSVIHLSRRPRAHGRLRAWPRWGRPIGLGAAGRRAHGGRGRRAVSRCGAARGARRALREARRAGDAAHRARRRGRGQARVCERRAFARAPVAMVRRRRARGPRHVHALLRDFRRRPHRAPPRSRQSGPSSRCARGCRISHGPRSARSRHSSPARRFCSSSRARRCATSWRESRDRRRSRDDGGRRVRIAVGLRRDFSRSTRSASRPFVLAVVGLVVDPSNRMAARRCSFSAFPVAFLLFIANTVPASRYLNPILPFAAVLAGAAVASARAQRGGRAATWRRWPSRRRPSLEAGAASLRIDLFFRQTDTRTLALEWIDARRSRRVRRFWSSRTACRSRPRATALVEALTAHLGSAGKRLAEISA